MTRTKVDVYRQTRPADYLKDHPGECWRCDIFPLDKRSSHHGVGATEAEAIFNASLSWRKYETGE